MSIYVLFVFVWFKPKCVYIHQVPFSTISTTCPSWNSQPNRCVWLRPVVCTCPLRYYTDFNYPPVRLIAQASLTGHGTNVIAGMSVGVWDRIMWEVVAWVLCGPWCSWCWWFIRWTQRTVQWPGSLVISHSEKRGVHNPRWIIHPRWITWISPIFTKSSLEKNMLYFWAETSELWDT